eukprot:TRINITY_DN37865_c0_g1_i1.p1 TRINITY_DN37865_c0_g1~~TRINITY_DN37865_c0_g1_i1.p1  ORF type:complete len:622 (+),score=88.23 TRINITY_DN37865_c0_g1_i1:74-1939(+)
MFQTSPGELNGLGTGYAPFGASAGIGSYGCGAAEPAASAQQLCTNCGQIMMADSQFCRHCGHKREQATSYDAAIQGMPTLINGNASALNGFDAVPKPVGLDGASAGAKLLSGERIYSGLGQTSVSPCGAFPAEAVRPAGEGIGLDFDPRLDRNSTSTPVAIAAVDTNGDGRADTLVTGVDRDGDGIPDVLQEPRVGATSMAGGLGYSSSMPQHNMYEAQAAYRTATPVRARGESEVSEAKVQYAFPTAGSFVAEPYREGGMPAYPRQPSYPSSVPDRRYEARSSSPMPGRMSPMYGGAIPGSNAVVSYGAEGPGFRERSYSPGPAGSYGIRTNGYAVGQPNGYGYPGAYTKGDTYSGGTMSYAPPPGRCGSFSPCYGGGPPLPSSNNLTYSFPTAASFVAEPFNPAAPVISPTPSRTPSFVPPPLPGSYAGFSGLGGFGGQPSADGFSGAVDGIASPQYGGAGGLGRGPSPFGGSLLGNGLPGGSSLFQMPPSNASFLADPASFVAPATGGFGGASSNSFGLGANPLGAAAGGLGATMPGACGSSSSAAARGRSVPPAERERELRALETAEAAVLLEEGAEAAALKRAKEAGGGPRSSPKNGRASSERPKSKKKSSRGACC